MQKSLILQALSMSLDTFDEIEKIFNALIPITCAVKLQVFGGSKTENLRGSLREYVDL